MLRERWFPHLSTNWTAVKWREVTLEAIRVLRNIAADDGPEVVLVQVYTDGSGGTENQEPAYGFIAVAT